MPRYIKPLEPPRVVQPSDPSVSTPSFRLDASERFLYDLVAQEIIGACGTECDVYQRSRTKSKVDPLYGEPISNFFDGPYTLLGHIEWPEGVPEVSEEGERLLWPSGLWVPRKSLEDIGAKAMNEGDIVRFWKLPYFDNEATNGVPSPTGGFFFDVIKVNDDGHLHDSAAFVGFRCDLKRRSNSPPEVSFDTEKGIDDDC